jgi:hypothetical protein
MRASRIPELGLATRPGPGLALKEKGLTVAFFMRSCVATGRARSQHNVHPPLDPELGVHTYEHVLKYTCSIVRVSFAGSVREHLYRLSDGLTRRQKPARSGVR